MMVYENTWLSELDVEDIHFIKKFVLSSGSLKEIAEIYQVSYPTVRLRLDRLIQKNPTVRKGGGKICSSGWSSAWR